MNVPAEDKSSFTQPQKPWQRRRVRWLFLFLIGIWAIDGSCVLWQGWQTVVTPVPSCNTEMHIADGIRSVAEGRALYPAVDGLPYVYHFYHPLTYLPAGLAGRWLNLDVDGLLIAGRILPFLSALGLVALLAWYVWRQSGDPYAAALVAGMLLFFHSSTLTDFFRNRPETPAILLSLGGWVLCQRRPRHWIAYAALCFALAIALKQTFVAAPIACGLQLLLTRQYRPLATLTAATGILVLATVAAGYFWLGEGFFDHTIWAMQSNPIRPIAASARFYPILVAQHWGLLFPISILSIWWLHSRKFERGLIIYLTTCLLVTTFFHGKFGADLNYHGELSTLMVLATALALTSALAARSWVGTCSLALLAAAACGPLALHGAGWNQVSYHRLLPQLHSFAPPEANQGAAYASRYAGQRDSALILDDEIAVRLGQPVVTDWVAATIMFHTGMLDFQPLLGAIEQRKFDLIVMRRDQTDNWAQALYATAIANGYRLTLRDQRILELRPG